MQLGAENDSWTVPHTTKNFNRQKPKDDGETLNSATSRLLLLVRWLSVLHVLGVQGAMLPSVLLLGALRAILHSLRRLLSVLRALMILRVLLARMCILLAVTTLVTTVVISGYRHLLGVRSRNR